MITTTASAPDLDRLPDIISKAADARHADLIPWQHLGDELVDCRVGTRRWEWMQMHTSGGYLFSELSDLESK